MEQKWITKMKKEKRLKLTTGQIFFHYFIALFLLFVTTLITWGIIKNYTGDNLSYDLFVYPLFFFLLAVIFCIAQYRTLRFKEINISYSNEEFAEAVLRTTEELGWTIENNNKMFFCAKRCRNWPEEWGEMITIIKEKDYLLINSISDPDARFSIGSYYWNKRNIRTFINNLADVKAGMPAKQKVKPSQSEWTCKKVITRLFLYPLSILFVILGIYLLSEPLKDRHITFGLIAIVVPLVYLCTDIMMIFKKKNQMNNPGMIDNLRFAHK